MLSPAQLNKGTVPNLWHMKESVRKQIANWHGQDMLFIIQAFLAVEFVLHMGVGVTAPAMTTRPRVARPSGPPKPPTQNRSQTRAKFARVRWSSNLQRRATLSSPILVAQVQNMSRQTPSMSTIWP